MAPVNWQGFLVETIQSSSIFITRLAPVLAFSACWATAVSHSHWDWAGRFAAAQCFSGWRGLPPVPCHCVSSLSLSWPAHPPAHTTNTCWLSCSCSSSPTTSTSSSGSGWSPSVYSPTQGWGRYSEDTSCTSHWLQATTELPLMYQRSVKSASLLLVS